MVVSSAILTYSTLGYGVSFYRNVTYRKIKRIAKFKHSSLRTRVKLGLREIISLKNLFN